MLISAKKYYAFFTDRFLLKRSSKNWYTLDCPYCIKGVGKRNLAVHFEWEIIKCWSCGYRSRLIEFVMEYESLRYKEAKTYLYNYREGAVDIDLLQHVQVDQITDVNLPYGYKSILDGEGMLAVRARNYLESRGLDLEVLDTLGIGYVNERHPEEDDYFGYLIIPFKKRGALYYFIARDYIGNFLRYKNPAVDNFGIGKGELLFNEDALELYDTVFLTEGWACAVTMGKAGIAMLGVDLSVKQRSKILKSNCKKIVIITDAGFYKQGLKMGAFFLDSDKKVHVLNLDLIKEIGPDGKEKKDPNDLGREKVIELYKKTPLLTFDVVINEIM